MIAPTRASTIPYDDGRRRVSDASSSARRRAGWTDPARAVDAEPGLLERLGAAYRSRDLHRPASETKPSITLDAFRARDLRFDPIVGDGRCRRTASPHPTVCCRLQRAHPGRGAVLHRRHRRRRPQRAGRRRAIHRHRRAAQPAARRTVVDLLRSEGAIAVLDNINELEEVLT